MESFESWRLLPDLAPQALLNFTLDVCSEKACSSAQSRLCMHLLSKPAISKVWMVKISLSQVKIPTVWRWIIHLCKELKYCVSLTLKKTNAWRADESLERVRLAVWYISNQWQGWAGKSNLLMGLMECEMLKGRQSLAVCPLQLKPLSFCQ